MKSLMSTLQSAVRWYAMLGWPFLLLDVAGLVSWANGLAFLWVLAAAECAIAFVLDRAQRERAIARLCGLREHDERERAVTGDAARTTLLLTMAFQFLLLLMSLTSVRLVWNGASAPPQKRGLLEVGLQFSSGKHLSVSGSQLPDKAREPFAGQVMIDSFLVAPSTFPVLAVLLLLQIAAFRLLTRRRYEGAEA